MMDADNIIALSTNGMEFDNGLHQQLYISEKTNLASNGSLETEGFVENLENAVKLNDPATSESHSTFTSKEIDVDDSGNSKNLKPVKGIAKAKNGKSSVVPNGNVASESRPKQTVAVKVKSKSFNDRQTIDKSKATSIRNNKKPGNSDATSSTSGAQSDEHPGKTKLKALRKGLVTKVEETVESSPSPTSEEAKAIKSGTLPAYGFSFKCNERAEKRREFFSKLEEKIHAKEEEQNNLQAMTKETQEAEIRRLRKSLGFKATPMPTFYQEPAPPKVELKKIPTTRAKSPKLGRKKSSGTADSEVNGTTIARPARLSLDVKVSQTNVAKAPVAHVKKPLRKSLPKLPSENINLSNEKKKVNSRKTTTTNKEAGESAIENSSKETTEGVSEQDAGPTREPIETKSNIDDERVLEAQEQNVLQEPIRA